MKPQRILLLVGLAFVTFPVVAIAFWKTCRLYVPEDQCAVLISKWGDPLPPGQSIATEPGFLGIQEDVLGPGRYFFNPIFWDWQLKPLVTIPSGDPGTWHWISAMTDPQRDHLPNNPYSFKGEFPKIGVVVRKVGTDPPPGQVIVPRKSNLKGVLAEVLTPGTYRINPFVYEVETHPATVIPAGFVGVVTNLFQGDLAMAPGQPSTPAEPANPAGQASSEPGTDRRLLAVPGNRGTLRDVLQPGVYFINPKLQKVTLIEVGFNEFSQLKSDNHDSDDITFPSDTGFMIRVGVTVVWGIHPQHAAEIINEFGNVDRVLEKVIHPQLRSICRNIGSNYAARDFIQGEKREKFQQALTDELRKVCRSKNIEVVIALVHDIEVHAQGGDAVTDDLKRTIQESYIAIEKQLTKEKQREAAIVRAQLEEERKKVDIARETVQAQTRVRVETILAEGQKQAAQIEALGDLQVAEVQQDVAGLDAQRTRILGQANADVAKMKKQAEADGYRLLVQAFGSPQAYNLYTFAENFKPQSIRLFFAGDGTFWTDLSRFEEVGAAKLLQPAGSNPNPTAKP